MAQADFCQQKANTGSRLAAQISHFHLRVSKHLGLSLHSADHHHHNNRFTVLFPGPSGWASARRELLDFRVQGKTNRGRHTDHPAGRHSIRTKECPPPSSPQSLACLHSANKVNKLLQLLCHYNSSINLAHIWIHFSNYRGPTFGHNK